MDGNYRPQQAGLRKLLGDLEAEIMETVWALAAPTVTVRDVYEHLLASRRVAYTTVMTVMGNLVKKGVLAVEKSETAYLYRAPLAKDEFTRKAVGEILDGLFSDFSEAAMAHFVQTLSGKDDPKAILKARVEDAKRKRDQA